jgi:hypothetical protein
MTAIQATRRISPAGFPARRLLAASVTVPLVVDSATATIDVAAQQRYRGARHSLPDT